VIRFGDAIQRNICLLDGILKPSKVAIWESMVRKNLGQSSTFADVPWPDSDQAVCGVSPPSNIHPSYPGTHPEHPSQESAWPAGTRKRNATGQSFVRG
jgi:hypothetical protein